MKCRYCNGNDRDAPCAYPSEGKKGCLRDSRLKAERYAAVKNTIPDDIRAIDDFEPCVYTTRILRD